MIRRARPGDAWRATWFACALAGCDEPTALDLTLVADPKVNTVDQVLARTETMELVLDSPEGLYGPEDARDDGDLRIEDVDGDEPLELVARVPVPDARFPRVRLRRGGLPDVPLTIRLLGYDGSGEIVVAEGALDGVAFQGDSETLAIPFDLLAAELPPRVVDVVASPTSSCTPPSLTILFSRSVDPATVFAPGAIRFEPGGAPTSARIDAAGRLAIVVAPSDVVGSGRIRFSLSLATTIAAEDGSVLDQAPAAPGAQSYVGSFDARCSP